MNTNKILPLMASTVAFTCLPKPVESHSSEFDLKDISIKPDKLLTNPYAFIPLLLVGFFTLTYSLMYKTRTIPLSDNFDNKNSSSNMSTNETIFNTTGKNIKSRFH